MDYRLPKSATVNYTIKIMFFMEGISASSANQFQIDLNQVQIKRNIQIKFKSCVAILIVRNCHHLSRCVVVLHNFQLLYLLHLYSWRMFLRDLLADSRNVKILPLHHRYSRWVKC